MRLITPPFPAVSRPSNITTRRLPSRDDPLLHIDQIGLQAEQLGRVLLGGQRDRSRHRSRSVGLSRGPYDPGEMRGQEHRGQSILDRRFEKPALTVDISAPVIRKRDLEIVQHGMQAPYHLRGVRSIAVVFLPSLSYVLLSEPMHR